jgi:hypothetical protein
MPTALTPTASSRLPLRLAAAALLAWLALLAWEHLHGGIVTHHVLHNAALPGISNGWGLLVLPALAAWAGWRIERRLTEGTRPAAVLVGGAVALLLGAALSAAFVAGMEDATLWIFLSVLALGVLLPGYRAECWLGFVIGMCITFGAVIPTVIGGAIAALSALVHLGLTPAVVRGWKAVRRG